MKHHPLRPVSVYRESSRLELLSEGARTYLRLANSDSSERVQRKRDAALEVCREEFKRVCDRVAAWAKRKKRKLELAQRVGPDRLDRRITR